MTSLWDRKYDERDERLKRNERVVIFTNETVLNAMVSYRFFRLLQKGSIYDGKELEKPRFIVLDDVKAYLFSEFDKLKVGSKDQKTEDDPIIIDDGGEDIIQIEEDSNGSGVTKPTLENDSKLFELTIYQLLSENGNYIENEKTKKPLGDLFRQYGRGDEFSLLFGQKYRIFEPDPKGVWAMDSKNLPDPTLSSNHSNPDLHKESTILFHSFKRVISNLLSLIENWIKYGKSDEEILIQINVILKCLRGVGWKDGEISEFQFGVPLSELFGQFDKNTLKGDLKTLTEKRNNNPNDLSVDETNRYWSISLNIPICFAMNYLDLERLSRKSYLDYKTSPSVLYTGKMRNLIKRLRFMVSRISATFVLLNICPRLNNLVSKFLGGAFEVIVSNTFKIDPNFSFEAMMNSLETERKVLKSGTWIGSMMSVCGKKDTKIVKKQMAKYKSKRFGSRDELLVVYYLNEAYGFDYNNYWDKLSQNLARLNNSDESDNEDLDGFAVSSDEDEIVEETPDLDDPDVKSALLKVEKKKKKKSMESQYRFEMVRRVTRLIYDCLCGDDHFRYKSQKTWFSHMIPDLMGLGIIEMFSHFKFDGGKEVEVQFDGKIDFFNIVAYCMLEIAKSGFKTDEERRITLTSLSLNYDSHLKQFQVKRPNPNVNSEKVEIETAHENLALLNEWLVKILDIKWNPTVRGVKGIQNDIEQTILKIVNASGTVEKRGVKRGGSQEEDNDDVDVTKTVKDLKTIKALFLGVINDTSYFEMLWKSIHIESPLSKNPDFVHAFVRMAFNIKAVEFYGENLVLFASDDDYHALFDQTIKKMVEDIKFTQLTFEMFSRIRGVTEKQAEAFDGFCDEVFQLVNTEFHLGMLSETRIPKLWKMRSLFNFDENPKVDIYKTIETTKTSDIVDLHDKLDGLEDALTNLTIGFLDKVDPTDTSKTRRPFNTLYGNDPSAVLTPADRLRRILVSLLSEKTLINDVEFIALSRNVMKNRNLKDIDTSKSILEHVEREKIMGAELINSVKPEFGVDSPLGLVDFTRKLTKEENEIVEDDDDEERLLIEFANEKKRLRNDGKDSKKKRKQDIEETKGHSVLVSNSVGIYFSLKSPRESALSASEMSQIEILQESLTKTHPHLKLNTKLFGSVVLSMSLTNEDDIFHYCQLVLDGNNDNDSEHLPFSDKYFNSIRSIVIKDRIFTNILYRYIQRFKALSGLELVDISGIEDSNFNAKLRLNFLGLKGINLNFIQLADASNLTELEIDGCFVEKSSSDRNRMISFGKLKSLKMFNQKSIGNIAIVDAKFTLQRFVAFNVEFEVLKRLSDNNPKFDSIPNAHIYYISSSPTKVCGVRQAQDEIKNTKNVLSLEQRMRNLKLKTSTLKFSSLIGKDAKQVGRQIKEMFPDAEVILHPTSHPMTMDWKPKRIRVFYDQSGTVVSSPKFG